MIRPTRRRSRPARILHAAAGLLLAIPGCDRAPDPEPAAFDHRVSAERHWSAGGQTTGTGADISERLQHLWPSPDAIDEAIIARLDTVQVQRDRVRTLRADRDAHRANQGAHAPDDDGTDRLQTTRDLIALVVGDQLTLDDADLARLQHLGDARSLQQEFLWRMGDPDGDGLLNQEAADAFLRYLDDASSSEQQRLLMKYDTDADAVLSPAERAAAQEGLPRDLREFDRLAGVDIDLDGAVNVNEIELFLRRFQRGDAHADLNGDGQLGADDLGRFERAIAG